MIRIINDTNLIFYSQLGVVESIIIRRLGHSFLLESWLRKILRIL